MTTRIFVDTSFDVKHVPSFQQCHRETLSNNSSLTSTHQLFTRSRRNEAWDMEEPQYRTPRPMSADFVPSPISTASSFRSSNRGSFESQFGASSASSVSNSSIRSYRQSGGGNGYTYTKGSAQNWRNSWDSYHGAPGSGSPVSPSKLAIGSERKLTNKPGEAFIKLPEEILIAILEDLQRIHTGHGSDTCDTCWMRDACSLALTSRKWRAATRKVLYKKIHIVGSDSTNHIKKKFRWPIGCRLKLLRRTLRSHPFFAEQVRELKVPDVPETLNPAEREKYLDTIASLVMACPNLERLAGFYQPHDHEYSRLVQALATRKNLIEKIWVLDPNPYQAQGRLSMMDIPTYSPFSPNTLQLDQQATFRSHHVNWTSLQTLTIHCNQGAKLDHYLLVSVFQVLPALAHLHVSNISKDAFTDATICALPPLQSLRLEEITGVTDAGISRFVSRPESRSLSSFSLVHTPIQSLAVLARLFSNLRSLNRFTLLQSSPPSLPEDAAVFLQPYLANRSLQFLHWDILEGGNSATQLLALSIAHGGFPSLISIRAPCDDGSLQAQCRPAVAIELFSDRFPPPRPESSKSDRSNGSGSRHSSDMALRQSSLRKARQLAQARLDSARNKAKFHVVVWDEYRQPIERFELGRYLGVVGSPITFNLYPDIPGRDEALVRIHDMILTEDGGDFEQSEKKKPGATAEVGCCTGSWNSGHSKGKKFWMHQERKRWAEIKPEEFF